VNKKKNKYVLLEMLLYVITFISFFAVIFASFKAVETLNIITDDFYSGVLKVEKYDCIKRHSSNSAKSDCYVFGNIYSLENKQVCKNKKISLGIHTKVDFKKKSYKVFYRKNCKFPILNKNGLNSLNKTHYWWKLGWLFLPFIICSILLYLVKSINKKS
jgi:hypothetical protein